MLAEASEPGDWCGRTATDAAARQDAFLQDQLVCQRRLATAAEHNALAVGPEVIGEEVKFDLLETRVKQLAHLTLPENLADRADQDQDAAGHQEVDRLAEEAGLLPTSPPNSSSNGGLRYTSENECRVIRVAAKLHGPSSRTSG